MACLARADWARSSEAYVICIFAHPSSRTVIGQWCVCSPYPSHRTQYCQASGLRDRQHLWWLSAIAFRSWGKIRGQPGICILKLLSNFLSCRCNEVLKYENVSLKSKNCGGFWWLDSELRPIRYAKLPRDLCFPAYQTALFQSHLACFHLVPSSPAFLRPQIPFAERERDRDWGPERFEDNTVNLCLPTFVVVSCNSNSNGMKIGFFLIFYSLVPPLSPPMLPLCLSCDV